LHGAIGLGEGLYTIRKLFGHSQSQTIAPHAHLTENAARRPANT
jgi:hypothetical protein